MKKFLLFIAFLLVASVVALLIFIDPIIKHSVNTYGPRVLNVPVSLESAGVSFKHGAIELKGLNIGDEKDGNLKADRIFVDIDPVSLFGEVLIFDSIKIEGVAFNYAASGYSNVSKLLESMKKNEKTEVVPAKNDGKDSLERKIYIKDLDFINCSVSLSGMNRKMEVPFPDLRMQEIGNASSGITIKNAAVKIFTQLSIELVKAMQQRTSDMLKEGVEKGLSIGESISNMFK